MAWADKSYCAICKSICYTGGYWGDDENSICDDKCLLKYATNQKNIINDLKIEKYELRSQLEYTLERETNLHNKIKQAKEMADLLHRHLKEYKG